MLISTVAAQPGPSAKMKKSRDAGSGDRETFAETLQRRAADAEPARDVGGPEPKARVTSEGDEDRGDVAADGDRGLVESDAVEGEDAAGGARTGATGAEVLLLDGQSDTASVEAEGTRTNAAPTTRADASDGAATAPKSESDETSSVGLANPDGDAIANATTATSRDPGAVPAIERISSADRGAEAARGEPGAPATVARAGGEGTASSPQAQRTAASVSRQIAELTRKPLTVDSLNELLLTIDPSVAERLLRPSSIHGSVLAATDGNGAAHGERNASGARGSRGAGEGSEIAAGDATRGVEIARSLRTLLSEAGSGIADGAIGAKNATQDRGVTSQNVASERSNGASERADSARAASAADSILTSAAKGTSAVDASAIRAISPELASMSRATPGADLKDVAAPTVDGGARAGGVAGVGDARSQGGRFASANGDSALGTKEQSPSLESQLQRGLASAVNQRGGALLIRLQPEALGQLRIHLDMTDSGVNVRLDASSESAVDSLRELEADVRSSLEQKGLRVDKLEVRLDATLTQPRATETPAPAANDTARADESSGGFNGFGAEADGQSSSRGGWNDTGRGSSDQSWRRASERVAAADDIAGASVRGGSSDQSLNVVTPSRVHVLA